MRRAQRGVEDKMERAEADVEWQNGDQGTPNIWIDSSGAEERKYSWHPKPPRTNYLSAMQVSITIRYVQAVSSATGRPYMTVKCWKDKFKKKSKQYTWRRLTHRLRLTYTSTSSQRGNTRGEHIGSEHKNCWLIFCLWLYKKSDNWTTGSAGFIFYPYPFSIRAHSFLDEDRFALALTLPQLNLPPQTRLPPSESIP
jgi:hypothetical protein